MSRVVEVSSDLSGAFQGCVLVKKERVLYRGAEFVSSRDKWLVGG